MLKHIPVCQSDVLNIKCRPDKKVIVIFTGSLAMAWHFSLPLHFDASHRLKDVAGCQNRTVLSLVIGT